MSQPGPAASGGSLAAIHGRVAQLRNSRSEIDAKTMRIYEAMLRESRHLARGNFTAIHADDLARLHDLYDREFFGGMFRTLVDDIHRTKLTFRLSPRMTSAAGKTIRTRRHTPTPRGMITTVDYEIAISTLLLYQTFQEPGRPVVVCGLACADRLVALLRVFEHEAIHLLEMLVWGDSSCSAPNFQALAHRIFGHEGVRHELITPRERAATEFTLQVGDRVRFEYEGRALRGVLNRITRRASVLVPSPNGVAYSDGRTYLKYYVPLEVLVKDDA